MPANKLKTLAVAILLSTSSVAAFAATDTVSAYQTQTAMLKTSPAALEAISRAHAARVALFNNDIETARMQIADARSEFMDAGKTFNDLTVADSEKPDSTARYLPFDVSMSLSETFQPTDAHKEALQTAHGMMQNGSQDEALGVLRTASVDVNVGAALLPVDEVNKELRQAQDAIDTGKFFDANLALKAIEDSVIVRTYPIDAIPQQGVTTQ